MTPLGPHLTVFLREYIASQREMSVQTADTYAYAFQLLVCFAAERFRLPVALAPVSRFERASRETSSANTAPTCPIDTSATRVLKSSRLVIGCLTGLGITP